VILFMKICKYVMVDLFLNLGMLNLWGFVGGHD
jgi:hypothetical protein